MQEERNPGQEEDVEGLRPKHLDESDDEVEAHRFTQSDEPGTRFRGKPGEQGKTFGSDDPNRTF